MKGLVRWRIYPSPEPQGFTKLVVLIPFTSLDAYFKFPTQLATDVAYQQAGADYLAAEATAPAYERVESSLLQAFTGMPKVEVPEQKPRLFELRAPAARKLSCWRRHCWRASRAVASLIGSCYSLGKRNVQVLQEPQYH